MSDADRVALRSAEEDVFGVTPDGVNAQGTLTLDTNPTDTDTMTIDGRTYIFQDTLTNVDGNIHIGVDLAATKLNLLAAMRLTGGVPGTDYAEVMTVHATVQPDEDGFTVDDLILEAVSGGTAGNAIVTTETFTAGTNIFDAATLGTTVLGALQDFDEVRYTSESLHQESDTTESQEIRSDRQTAAIVRTAVSAAGDINVEVSHGAGTFEDYLASGLQSAGFSSEVAVAAADANVSASPVDNSFNHSGSWDNDPVAGSWIQTAGFTNAGNNGFFKVVSVSGSNKIVVSGGTVVSELAGASVTIDEGGQIVNGTTFRSHTIEKEFTDLTDIFSLFNGCGVSALTLSITADGILTAGFTFLGTKETPTTATAVTGSSLAAPSNQVMAAVDNVLSVLEGQSEQEITQFDLSLNNNLRERMIVGKLGADSIGSGKLNLSGTLQMYFEDQAIMTKFTSFTLTSLAIIAQDESGNVYILDIPAVRYSAGQAAAGGVSQDVIADMGWASQREATENIMIRIVKF